MVTLSLAPWSGSATVTAANGLAGAPVVSDTGAVPATVGASFSAVALTTTVPADTGAVPGLDRARLSVVAMLLPGAAWCAVGVKRSAASSAVRVAGEPDTA